MSFFLSVRRSCFRIILYRYCAPSHLNAIYQDLFRIFFPTVSPIFIIKIFFSFNLNRRSSGKTHDDEIGITQVCLVCAQDSYFSNDPAITHIQLNPTMTGAQGPTNSIFCTVILHCYLFYTYLCEYKSIMVRFSILPTYKFKKWYEGTKILYYWQISWSHYNRA